MTKLEILDNISREKVVEDIIGNLKASASEEKRNLQDLKQDIYYELLMKPSEVIESLYERGQLRFYITRMIISAIQSKTSRYYYTYKKNKTMTVNIDDTVL